MCGDLGEIRWMFTETKNVRPRQSTALLKTFEGAAENIFGLQFFFRYKKEADEKHFSNNAVSTFFLANISLPNFVSSYFDFWLLANLIGFRNSFNLKL